jgi:hypothetical protein
VLVWLAYPAAVDRLQGGLQQSTKSFKTAWHLQFCMSA